MVRPRFRHYMRRHASPQTSYTPVQIAKYYQFPQADGTGVTIGYIELGGAFDLAGLQASQANQGLSVPDVEVISVNGATPVSDGPNGADGEVALDIEIGAGIAPNAKHRIYFADNSNTGFLAAINQAVADGCDVVSISWGGPESGWDAATIAAFNGSFRNAANQGVTVTVAAGDNGSSDGTTTNTVDFPAGSPFVLSCGGTRIVPGGMDVVWNDGTQGGATGGGYSTANARPDYQATDVTNPGRGVPDVAGNADPVSGWVVYVDGQQTVIGGTSAVAPMWAGLIARLQQLNGGKRLGFLNPLIYALPGSSGAFYDVTVGSNGAYAAGSGWDACTGLGEPVGVVLAKVLGGPVSPPPPPPPPPSGPPIKNPPNPCVVLLQQLDTAVIGKENELLAQYGRNPPVAAGIVLGARTALQAIRNVFEMAPK